MQRAFPTRAGEDIRSRLPCREKARMLWRGKEIDRLLSAHAVLEADGLITRTVFAEVPPRVEYEMTQKARGFGPTMEALATWREEYGKTIPKGPGTRGRTPNKTAYPP